MIRIHSSGVNIFIYINLDALANSLLYLAQLVGKKTTSE